MTLTGKKRTESTSSPGVFFTIRHLNQIQRAKRDMPILKERAEYTQAVQSQQAVLESIWGSVKRATFEDGEAGDKAFAAARNELYVAAPAEVKAKADLFYEQQDGIFRSVILPATIRAALVQIEGLLIDGKQILTVDDFLEQAPDTLIDEVWRLCSEASGLTADQQKN